MVKYACAFNQSELGKYFEWIIIIIKSNDANWYNIYVMFYCAKSPSLAFFMMTHTRPKLFDPIISTLSFPKSKGKSEWNYVVTMSNWFIVWSHVPLSWFFVSCGHFLSAAISRFACLFVSGSICLFRSKGAIPEGVWTQTELQRSWYHQMGAIHI